MKLAHVYAALAISIAFEVAGTSMLQASHQFTKPLPTTLMALSYAGAIYCLSLTLVNFPVGIAYAIWSGMGMVMIATIGAVVFHQKLDLPAVLGLGLIICGVAVVNLFSKSLQH